MAGERDPIDYADLAHALLQRAETLVPQWLPGGTIRGHEYVCADLGGGAGGSCSVNLATGRWADFSGDDAGGDLISLYAAIHNLNQSQAARRLIVEMGWARRGPMQTPAPRTADGPRPEPPPAEESEATPATGKKRSVWVPVVPVPAHAKPCDFWHWHYKPDDLVASWEYRFEGVFYGHVARFRTSDGGKETLPYTWCVDESDGRGTSRWHTKQWDEPRPLYVPATVLSGDPGNVPVVLVEGEKCAMAGHVLLGHEFDIVSWPGGGNAWSKASWSWLMGRTVYLWADCDAKRQKLTKQEREQGIDPDTKPLLPDALQPGVKAMVAIGSLLVAEFGCTVYWCPVPKAGDVSDGWDIADAIEQGWGPEEVRGFIRGARSFVPPDDAARTKARAREAISTPSNAAAGSGDDADAWRSWLLNTAQGAIKPVRENVALALDGVPSEGVPGVPEVEGILGFNELTNDVVKLRATPWKTEAGSWGEVDDLLMGEWLVRQHWLPSMPRGTLEEAVRMVAYRNRYHPVRDYLQRLQWDQVPRLKTWLRRACLEEDEYDPKDLLQRYLARVGTFFLMAMCARVMTPGIKFDYMMILEGPQGMRKSTLLRTLAGEFFADTGLVLGDKDSYQQLQGRWLYEMGELDGLSKADILKVKSYLASCSDYFRASFDRRARDYPRQVVFAGTTNEDHYLVDPTGNRRFWPVRVTRLIDIDWVMAHRDQLFAEAMVRVQAGARMYPTPEEELDLFLPQQQNRAVENAIESAVARYLYPPDNAAGPNSDGDLVTETTLVQLLGKIGIGIEKLGPGRFHEKQAAAALRRLGWLEGRSSGPGRPRVYRRPVAGGSMDSINRSTQSDQPAGGDDDCPF